MTTNPRKCCEICYERLRKIDMIETEQGSFCSPYCQSAEQIIKNIMSVQSQYNIQQQTQGDTFVYPNAEYTFKALLANKVSSFVEVPKEQYREILSHLTPQVMAEHFSSFASPKDLIRCGSFSYFDAKTLAKYSPWNEKIAYYCPSSQIVHVRHIPGFHASATLSFVYSVWNGKTGVEALLEAAKLESAHSFGSKNKNMRSAYDYISKKLSATAVNDILKWNTGSLILSALFSSNFITSTLSMAFWSALDLYWYSKGLQSSEQTGKNIATTGVGVLAGGTGSLVGAVVGSLIFPGVGTVIGGLLGGFGAGVTSTIATKKTLDLFIEDDVVKMQKVFLHMLELISVEYNLTQQELNIFLKEEIPKIDMQKKLYEMFASHQPEKHATAFLKPILVQVMLSERKRHLKMKTLVFPNVSEIEESISKHWRNVIVTYELVTDLRTKQQKRDRTDVAFSFH